MDDPKPLRLTDDEAGRILREAQAIAAPAPGREAAQWARLEERLGPPRRGLLVPVLVGAAVVAAGFAIAVFPRAPEPQWRELETGLAGRVEIGRGAQLTPSTSGARSVALSAGSLRASDLRFAPGQSLEVVTPHLRVVAAGPSFELLVARELTLLTVRKGPVRAISPAGKALDLTDGEVLRSDDPRLLARAEPAPQPSPLALAAPLAPEPARAEPLPAASAPAPQPSVAPRLVADCAREPSLDAQRSCFLSFTSAGGLSAQNALYALGRLERESGDGSKAAEYWSMYQRRFPDGALAPEVAVDLVHLLTAERRYPEAVAVAEAFQARFPDDARADELALARANLLCTRLSQFERASDAYEVSLLAKSAALRDEALFAFASCEVAHGSRTRAQEHLRRYLRDFPAGAHAREAEQLLSR